MPHPHLLSQHVQRGLQCWKGNCPRVSQCSLRPLFLFIHLLFLLLLLFMHYYFTFTHCILLSMSISLNLDVSLIISYIICMPYCSLAHLRCCHPWTPLFVCTFIISIPLIVYALLLHVHLLYFILCVYLTQLRCLTYYYIHYMYTLAHLRHCHSKCNLWGMLPIFY